MKLKNILLSGLSLVLVAALAIGGTVAYLQDDDSDVNVMTLGNVKIEQHEYERKVDADGNYTTATIDGVTSYELKDFTQGKPLLPATEIDANGNPYNFGAGNWDNTVVRMTQVGSYGGMQVFTSKNAQDKFVVVENTGKTDAYIRTIVAIEIGDASASLIGSSYHQTWTENEVGTIVVDGNKYFVFEYVYNGANGTRHDNGILPAGATSYPNLSQVYITAAATNEDMVKLDGNGNGTLDILVVSQAVQAAGFENAQTALDTAFGKSADKAAEWFGGMGNVQFADAPSEKAQVTGEDAAQVLAALTEGKDLIVDKEMDLIGFDTNEVDAKGANVTLAGVGPDAYGYLAFLPDAGEDVAISNLNVTGSGFVEIGHYGMGGGNYTVNNVKIENLASTLRNENKGFNLGCAFMTFGDVTLNNCVMTGTTAVQDDTIPVDLGCGQAWSGYTDDDDNKISTTINGGEYGTVYCWSHAIVTVNGAKVDTLYASPINGTVTVKAGTEIDTLNIAYGTSAASAARLAKLVIEDGATIGKIVFSDKDHTAVTFNTVAEWNAYVVANFN